VGLGALGTGSNAVVSITASTSGAGVVTNVARVTSGELELASADNTAQATVTIAPAVVFSLYGARQLNGQFLVTVSNAVIGKTYVVEAATNLARTITNTVWTPIGTNNNTPTSTFLILDPAAGAFRNRIYRGIER